MMCKPKLSTQLLIPIRKHTQTRSAFISVQVTGKSASFTTSIILHLAKLNVERYLPTHFNTIYTGDFKGHSPLWGYHDHNATWHIIGYMLIASYLILLYVDTTTPTLCHRSTGTPCIPDMHLVSADIVN